jgi:hypothetical protein
MAGYLAWILLGVVVFMAPNALLSQATTWQAWLSLLLQGAGSSIVASGVVMFSTVGATKRAERRRVLEEELNAAGVVGLHSKRSSEIKETYAKLLADMKSRIDVLGFGLVHLREDYRLDFAAWSTRARVRVLLLNPDFPSSGASSAADIRDAEENSHAGRIRGEINQFIADYRANTSIDKTKFEVRLYNALPTINMFRVDETVIWGPYFIGGPSRNMPSFVVKGGYLNRTLDEHFDHIWNNLSVPVGP